MIATDTVASNVPGSQSQRSSVAPFRPAYSVATSERSRPVGSAISCATARAVASAAVRA